MNKNLIPAATVLLLRDSKVGIEVLMVKRSKKSPFGNLYVFPGGKIDDDDCHKDWKFHSDGHNDSKASEILGLSSNGLSYWIACIRESFEEVGILLAKRKSGEKLNLEGHDKKKFDVYRKDLINQKISFLEICEKEDLMLSTENIAPLSHWITPDFEIKRFDTRFFIAYLPDNQIVQHDGMELTQSLWINPNDALKKAMEGDMQMILPTTENLKLCSSFNRAKDMLENQKNMTKNDIKPILPKFFKENGNWNVLFPGEEGYEDH
tara:strand:- start:1813 stop:2604 length:792 start_codon:yes stop_codon:yes gene_type:complete